jgi:TetR/AcrR family fatty acid metabolism transcriptional regulator
VVLRKQRGLRVVVMLVLKTNRKFVDTEAYQAVREGYGLIIDVIREGMESGEFRTDLDPYLVRAVLLGAIEHQVIRRTLLGQPNSLVDLVDPLTDMIIGGIIKAPEVQTYNLKLTVESLPAEIIKRIYTQSKNPESVQTRGNHEQA